MYPLEAGISWLRLGKRPLFSIAKPFSLLVYCGSSTVDKRLGGTYDLITFLIEYSRRIFTRGSPYGGNDSGPSAKSIHGRRLIFPSRKSPCLPSHRRPDSMGREISPNPVRSSFIKFPDYELRTSRRLWVRVFTLFMMLRFRFLSLHVTKIRDKNSHNYAPCPRHMECR